MAFQIKDFVSIVAGALNHMRGSTDKISDFRVGSVARTLIEGPAVEIEELYQQMFIGLREAIPVATYLSFGFGRLPAAYSTGVVTVNRAGPEEQPLVIPQGTVFKASDGRTYSSTADVTWLAAASSVDVPVVADTVGIAGNISTGGVSASDFFSAQPVSITNTPMLSGRDAETDAEREARFAEFIQSLSRGTEIAVRYAVRQAQILDEDGQADEYVSRVGFAESGGRVWLYIYSSLGVPSSELLDRGQRIIDGYVDLETGVVVPGYRSAGVRVDVLPMIERTVSSSIQVAMFAGYSLGPSVVNAMTDIFHVTIRSVPSGAVLYINELVERLLTVPGVRRVVVDNDENVLCAENEVLIPGALTVGVLDD